MSQIPDYEILEKMAEERITADNLESELQLLQEEIADTSADSAAPLEAFALSERERRGLPPPDSVAASRAAERDPLGRNLTIASLALLAVVLVGTLVALRRKAA